MSEDPGSSDSTEPPSYPFTGSVVKMNTEDFFSFKPIPEGMKPIIDPNTRMCIGYEGIESIGYDPTYKYGFFKYSFIYDINEKVVDQYKRELTAEDINAMSPEELEEYNKFRRTIFDAEDHGMFGSSDNVWLMVATDAASEALPYAVHYTRVTKDFFKRSPEYYKRSRKILKTRQERIKNAIARGETPKEPTKIEISKAVLAAPIVFVLRSKFKMGLSAKELRFEKTALDHMEKPERKVPLIFLEDAIRNGVKTPDSANRAFGFMYKTYTTLMYKNGEPCFLEVIVNERTWTIKHFQYSEFQRLGKLSKGKWSGRIGQWIEDYDKNTVFGTPHIKGGDKGIEQFKKDVYYNRFRRNTVK